ncbi:MAG: D-alanyl-D-alanine carboxypeptidase/D-alanyl-D-alanine-endopeptidase, partial [Gemmatimonadaceae bacterium]|nr:D-alanyl-D-alanine carboxypeptidase/D-alanyl-D-alanine-endopeptidase [Gemmatimonadaceae bacterium]
MRLTHRFLCLAGLAGCASSTVPVVTTSSSSPVVAVSSPGPVIAAPSARVALRQYVDSLIEVPEFRSANWGVLIVDPVRGDTLYSRNADKLFMPASNMKLLTGGTALAQLGPDYRWSTTVLARGPVRDGTLAGDLVLRGTGDPSVSAHMHPTDGLAPLRALADSVRAHGITRIRGRLVAAPSPFVDAPLGYGWSWDDLDDAYSAGVDALYFNEGFSEVVVRGGARAGDAARTATRPASSYPALINRVRTVERARAGASTADSDAARPHITVGQDSSRSGVLVTGTIA